jgi:hypothetical protein
MPLHTASILTEYVEQLIRSERYDEDEGCYHFNDGGDMCGVCTSGALKVAAEFHGAVWGYSADENPLATIGQRICSGHDFAVVHNRWLVDYRGYRYAEAISRPVLDIEKTDDRDIIHTSYGDAERWTCVASFAVRPLIAKDRFSVVGHKGFVGFRDFARQANWLPRVGEKVLL